MQSRRDFAKTLGLGAIGLSLGAVGVRAADHHAVSGRQEPAVPQLVRRRAPRGQAPRLLVRRHPLHAQPFERRGVRNGQIHRGGNVGFGNFGDEDTYGFGVRVIHGGVWGFCEQPARDARGDQARRRRRDRRRPRQRHREEVRRAAGAGEGVRRVLADADQGRSVDRAARGEGRAPARRHARRCRRTRTCCSRTRPSASSYEWKYLATSEGSFIEQVFYFTACVDQRDRAHRRRRSRRAPTSPAPGARLRVPDRQATCPATPSGSPPKPSSISMAKPVGRASRI